MRNRLPGWFRQELPDGSVKVLRDKLAAEKINTVCRQARCPNINSCFKERTATFLVLGNICTRACSFCAVKKGRQGEHPDAGEPARIAVFVRGAGLDYAVITSVTRDDLPDGGSSIFKDTIKKIRECSPKTRIELLIPDFSGDREAIKGIVDSGPDVIGHNLETVTRLYPAVRPRADYRRALGILKFIKEINPAMVTKSSLILGLGETHQEVIAAMRDLKAAGCDLLVLGQYLRPSEENCPVKRFVPPSEFEGLALTAESMGFKMALCGPKMRSSYKASLVYERLKYA